MGAGNGDGGCPCWCWLVIIVGVISGGIGLGFYFSGGVSNENTVNIDESNEFDMKSALKNNLTNIVKPETQVSVNDSAKLLNNVTNFQIIFDKTKIESKNRSKNTVDIDESNEFDKTKIERKQRHNKTIGIILAMIMVGIFSYLMIRRCTKQNQTQIISTVIT